MRRINACGIAFVLALALAAGTRAGVLALVNNTTDAILVDASRTDWAGVTAYPADSTGEAGIGPFDVDWEELTVANSSDQGTIYFRLRMANAADFNSFPAFYNLYIDADQDRGTGYLGSGSQFAIGADYLIQGANLYAFAGVSQTDFNWSYQTTLSVDNSFSSLDIELSLASGFIGSPAAFNLFLYADNALNGNTPDVFPDGADQGASGDYVEYRMALITSDEVALSALTLGSVTAFRVTNSLTNVTYRLESTPVANPTNWMFSGHESAGNGGDLLLFDVSGYSTAKLYRVSGEY